MKTILITGCAGFIGTNLIIRLLNDPNNQIIGIDNLLTSAEPHGINNERFLFLKWDVVKDMHLISIIPAPFTPLCIKNAQSAAHVSFISAPKGSDLNDKWCNCKIDEIYHLASIASPPKYRKYPIETLDVNVIGTRNMLDLAVKHGAKFLLTSTSEVYGDPLEHPQKESYYGNVNTVGERSCYDESKRCAETYVYEYRRKYGADFKICRIFNTYGPYMDIDDGRVITNIINRSIHNHPITIYGDGEQTRSFCYIDDMLDGLVALMDSREVGPINLGNPDTECTMNELVREFEKIFGYKLVVANIPKMENDPLVRKPDISSAKRLLGFSPKIGLEEGLRRTFKHFCEMSPPELLFAED